MTQVLWSDGDNLVTTGWDSLTARFHLSIEDAPTGREIYDCWLSNESLTAMWIIAKLDELHIERPIWLGGELSMQQALDAKNLVMCYHHQAEHDLLGEPRCPHPYGDNYPTEGQFQRDIPPLEWYRA